MSIAIDRSSTENHRERMRLELQEEMRRQMAEQASKNPRLRRRSDQPVSTKVGIAQSGSNGTDSGTDGREFRQVSKENDTRNRNDDARRRRPSPDQPRERDQPARRSEDEKGRRPLWLRDDADMRDRSRYPSTFEKDYDRRRDREDERDAETYTYRPPRSRPRDNYEPYEPYENSRQRSSNRSRSHRHGSQDERDRHRDRPSRFEENPGGGRSRYDEELPPRRYSPPSRNNREYDAYETRNQGRTVDEDDKRTDTHGILPTPRAEPNRTSKDQYADELRRQMAEQQAMKRREKNERSAPNRSAADSSPWSQGDKTSYVGVRNTVESRPQIREPQQQQHHPRSAHENRDPNPMSNRTPNGIQPFPGRNPEEEANKQADKRSQYLRDLDEQIRLKKEASNNTKVKQNMEDYKKDQEIAAYNPWGKSGAGAPLRNADGSVVVHTKTYLADQVNHPSPSTSYASNPVVSNLMQMPPQVPYGNPYYPQVPTQQQQINPYMHLGLVPPTAAVSGIVPPSLAMSYGLSAPGGYADYSPYSQPLLPPGVGATGTGMGIGAPNLNQMLQTGPSRFPPVTSATSTAAPAEKSFLRGAVDISTLPEWAREERRKKQSGVQEIQEALRQQIAGKEREKMEVKAREKEEEAREAERVRLQQQALEIHYRDEIDKERKKAEEEEKAKAMGGGGKAGKKAMPSADPKQASPATDGQQAKVEIPISLDSIADAETKRAMAKKLKMQEARKLAQSPSISNNQDPGSSRPKSPPIQVSGNMRPFESANEDSVPDAPKPRSHQDDRPIKGAVSVRPEDATIRSTDSVSDPLANVPSNAAPSRDELRERQQQTSWSNEALKSSERKYDPSADGRNSTSMERSRRLSSDAGFGRRMNQESGTNHEQATMQSVLDQLSCLKRDLEQEQRKVEKDMMNPQPPFGGRALSGRRQRSRAQLDDVQNRRNSAPNIIDDILYKPSQRPQAVTSTTSDTIYLDRNNHNSAEDDNSGYLQKAYSDSDHWKSASSIDLRQRRAVDEQQQTIARQERDLADLGIRTRKGENGFPSLTTTGQELEEISSKGYRNRNRRTWNTEEESNSFLPKIMPETLRSNSQLLFMDDGLEDEGEKSSTSRFAPRPPSSSTYRPGSGNTVLTTTTEKRTVKAGRRRPTSGTSTLNLDDVERLNDERLQRLAIIEEKGPSTDILRDFMEKGSGRGRLRPSSHRTERSLWADTTLQEKATFER